MQCTLQLYILTHRTPPLAQGNLLLISYVINASGNDQINGMTHTPIIAYKFPAAFRVGSIPNGPPEALKNIITAKTNADIFF